MDQNSLKKLFNSELNELKIEVRFTKESLKDFEKLDQQNREFVLALILAQARKNPLPRPYGSGKPLSGRLKGICKIKARSHSLRILYSVKKNRIISMSILIIGPRENDEVYKRVLRRLKDRLDKDSED